MPRASAARAAAAIGLVILAVLLGALYRIVSGTEHHAFANGAVPLDSAHLTIGKAYTLSTPGGVQRLIARGVDPNAAQCEWSVDGSASQALTVAPAAPNTKAINVVASFVAPYTGDIHIDCLGWGPMFLDDADTTSADYAGWLLLLATMTLTGGVVLAMVALRAVGANLERTAREDDEIERLVHAVHIRSADHEVPRHDGGDVGA